MLPWSKNDPKDNIILVVQYKMNAKSEFQIRNNVKFS